MKQPSTHPRPAPERKRDDARERAATMRAEQAAADRRRRVLIYGAVVAVVVALVAAVGIAVQVQRDDVGAAILAAPPRGTTGGGTAVTVGSGEAAVTVEVFEDFQCPACAEFERVSGGVLDRLVDDGKVRIVYHPMAFLDHASTDEYSSRALNAAGCVLDAGGPGAYRTIHAALFAEQPAEGGPGLPDTRLVTLAAAAGVRDGAVSACIQDRHFHDWTRKATDAASKAGIAATPTVLVAGERLTDTSPQAVVQAVDRAATG